MSFIVSCKRSIIVFNIRQEDGFLPSGRLPGDYGNLEDLFVDEKDNLYILDNRNSMIRKYSLAEESFLPIGNTGKTEFYYDDICSYLNGRARGIAVRNSCIYLVCERGTVVKIDADGRLAARFGVSLKDTGLWVRAAKEFSQSWLESIAIDIYGNIYVLDVNAGQIHVLDENLNYISSWCDPQHPFDEDVHDINFVRGMDYLFITNYWGFYVYKTRPGLAGIKMDRDFLYPGLVCGKYPGIHLEWSVIGSGKLFLKLQPAGGGNAYLLYQKQLSLNAHSEFLWQGKTAAGEAIPCGKYFFAFYLDGELAAERPVELVAAPALTVSGDDNQIITAASPLVNFQLEPDQCVQVRVWISSWGSDEMIRCLLDRDITAEPFNFTWDYNSQPWEYGTTWSLHSSAAKLLQ